MNSREPNRVGLHALVKVVPPAAKRGGDAVQKAPGDKEETKEIDELQAKAEKFIVSVQYEGVKIKK